MDAATKENTETLKAKIEWRAKNVKGRVPLDQTAESRIAHAREILAAL